MAPAGANLRLYSGPLSMFGMKAEIALREKGLDFDLIMVPFDMARLYEPKHPDVTRINPKAQVPVLIHGDVEVFDSTQIFEYLEELQPEPPLWPAALPARTEARQTELKSDEVFFPQIIRLFRLQDRLTEPAAVEAIGAASAFYDQMEQRLGDRAFLAGDYSYADIAFYMAQIYAHRMNAPMGDHPRLRAWRDRVSERPAIEFVMRRLVVFLASHKRPIPDFMQRFAPN